MKKIISWNNYPKIKHKSIESIENTEFIFTSNNNLPHGLGRSYGYVFLNENENLILITMIYIIMISHPMK